MEKNLVRFRYRFTGMVQGVGFRYRAKYAAELLGLTGWVENEWDGSVISEVQGTAEMVNRWVPTITASSHWIAIEHMERTEQLVRAEERGFSVRG